MQKEKPRAEAKIARGKNPVSFKLMCRRVTKREMGDGSAREGHPGSPSSKRFSPQSVLALRRLLARGLYRSAQYVYARRDKKRDREVTPREKGARRPGRKS